METVIREIEVMVFEQNIKTAEIRERMKNIKRIKREKCIVKIKEKMKLKLKYKQ